MENVPKTLLKVYLASQTLTGLLFKCVLLQLQLRNIYYCLWIYVINSCYIKLILLIFQKQEVDNFVIESGHAALMYTGFYNFCCQETAYLE